MAVLVNIVLITIALVSRYNGQETNEEFVPEIPEECKSLGYCTDVPNYPTEYVDQLIDKLKEEGKLEDPAPVVRRSVRDDSQAVELCDSTTREVLILAAADAAGSWHYVLKGKYYEQGYVVDLCNNIHGPCRPDVQLQFGYAATCEQKFIFRSMQVLNKTGGNFLKELRLPSNCHCTVKTVDD